MEKIMQQWWGACMGELRVLLSTPSDSPSEGLGRRAIKLRPFPKPLTAMGWGQGWGVSTPNSVLHPLMLPTVS